MSRINKNNQTQYTIDEQINYLEKKLRDRNISKTQKIRYQEKIDKLKMCKKRYGVIYMEDERFFPNSDKDGHSYIIGEIDNKENIDVHLVTHYKKGTSQLSGFDGKSRVYKKVKTHDIRGHRLKAGDAYINSYSFLTLHPDDKAKIDKFRRERHAKKGNKKTS